MNTMDIGVRLHAGAGAHHVASSSAADDFRRVVEPHWNDLVRFARRMAPPDRADDVLQEALTNAWRKRHQFDPDRGEWKTWLLAIVANQSRKEHRNRRPHLELVDDGTGTPVAATGDTDADLDLHRALDALTTRQRAAVALHYYLGLPTAEVAAVLGCSAGTVKSTLSDARARLRHQLGKDYRNV